MVHPIPYFQLLTSDQFSASFGSSFDSCLIILVKTDSCHFPSKCARHLENFRMFKYYSICNRSYTRSVWDTMHNVLHKDSILYQTSAIIFYVLRSLNSKYEVECRNHNRNLRTHYVSLTKLLTFHNLSLYI